MKKLVLVLFLGLSLSCSRDEPEICCTVIDVAIDIKITNEQGKNLLEAGNEKFYSAYNKKGGDWVRSSESPLLISREDGNYLRIFANLENPGEDISQLKLVFPDQTFAIIKTELNRVNSNITVTRVWYNEILEWEQESQTERLIEVQKI